MNNLFCAKCNFSGNVSEVGAFHLCEFCKSFAPANSDLLERYIQEKVPTEAVNAFRSYLEDSKNKKMRGMESSAGKGKIVARPALGYSLVDGNLELNSESKQVQLIFEQFLSESISLNQLAKRHNLSVNGLKKVLTNFTYLGKVKFGKTIYEGLHRPLISSTTFNHVQDKLEKLGIKKI